MVSKLSAIKRWFSELAGGASRNRDDADFPDRRRRESLQTSGRRIDSNREDLYLIRDQNPRELLNPYSALRSTSSAYDVMLGNAIRFYDWVDEAVRLTPPLSAAIDTATSNLMARDRNWVAADDSDLAETTRAWAEEFCGPFVVKYLESALRNAIAHGLAVHEFVYEMQDGFDVPVYCSHAFPGNFTFDSLGQMYLVDFNLGQRGQRCHPIKFAKLVIPDKYNNQFGRSLVDELSFEIQARLTTRASWNRMLKTYGNPLAVSKINAMDDVDANRLQSALERVMSNLAGSDGVILPHGTEMDFIQRGASSASQPHLEELRYTDSLIVLKILGATLGILESQFGTRAQAEVHGEEANKRNMPLEQLAVQSFNAWVEALIKRNFGDDAPIPVLSVDFDNADDVDALIRVVELAATKLNLPLSRHQLYEVFGLAKPEDPDDEIVISPAPATSFSFSEKKNRRSVLSFSMSEIMDLIEADTTAEIGAGYVNLLDEITNELTNDKGLIRDFKNQLMESFLDSDGQFVTYNPSDELMDGLAAVAVISLVRSIEAFPTKTAVFTEENELDDVYKEYHKSVNMTASELEAWSKNPLSKEASLSDAPIRRNLRLLKKSKSQWTESDIADAKKTIAFVARMRKVPAGKSRVDGVSKRTISLKNWAFDPGKNSNFAEIRPLTAQEVELLMSQLEDPAMRAGIAWMREREIITRRELEDMISQIVSANPLLPAGQVSKVLRETRIAIAKSVSNNATQAVRERVAVLIGQGETQSTWMASMLDLLDTGALANADTGYLQTVFRTETGNVYAAEQAAWESNPDVADGIWGYRFSSSRLDSSRPSHVAMDGLQCEKTSEAWAILSYPPWDYNCACVAYPLFLGAEDFNESPNILEVAKNVSRFDNRKYFGEKCCNAPVIFPDVVDRLARKLIRQGQAEDRAWAIAWAAYNREQNSR